jgi:hypothetical protein
VIKRLGNVLTRVLLLCTYAGATTCMAVCVRASTKVKPPPPAPFWYKDVLQELAEEEAGGGGMAIEGLYTKPDMEAEMAALGGDMQNSAFAKGIEVREECLLAVACGGVFPLGSGASRVQARSPVAAVASAGGDEWTRAERRWDERMHVCATQVDKEQDKAELKLLLRKLERKDRAERIMHTGLYAFAAVLGCATALYLSTRGYNLGTNGGARSLPSPFPPPPCG